MSAPIRVPAGNGVLSGRYAPYVHAEPGLDLAVPPATKRRPGTDDSATLLALAEMDRAAYVRQVAHNTLNDKVHAALSALVLQEYPTATEIQLEWDSEWRRPRFDCGGVLDADGNELFSGDSDEDDELGERIDELVCLLDISRHDDTWESILLNTATHRRQQR